MKLRWNGLGKLPALLERYKYPVAILLLGVALMLWPSRSAQEGAEPSAPPELVEAPVQDEVERYRAALEEELEGLLSQVQGAGRVRVMLTLKTGPAARFQTDRSKTESREGERSAASSEEKTVMQERGGAYTEPALVSTVYPEFRGAVIVAEGGGDERVRLRLSAAAAALLGLGTDQIIVVKMK